MANGGRGRYSVGVGSVCLLPHFPQWPQNIGKSMSCQEFITNLNGLRDGGNFPKELLKVRHTGLFPGLVIPGLPL